MSYLSGGNFDLLVARGKVANHTCVFKYGHAPDGVQTTSTDLWSRADATPTQQIWVAPTAARVHAIVSSDANDTSAGTGARTVKVYGLTGWGTAETSETVTMAGATPVNTSNSYVIVHRMEVITWGSSGPNVGLITATAAVDGTITAVIIATEGRTQMAIYGIPSTQNFYMTKYWVSTEKVTASVESVEARIFVNDYASNELTAFKQIHAQQLTTEGTSALEFIFDCPLIVTGPAIIKLNCLSTAADMNTSGGFSGTLITE